MPARKPKSTVQTVTVKPRPGEIIKPGELIDVFELVPLSLSARRSFNLLILNAWESITEDRDHAISKADLRGAHDSNDRLADTIRALMACIVEIETERDGKKVTRRVQLLGSNDEEHDEHGVLHYNFPKQLRGIIKNSTVYGRLRRDVMLALRSRYALPLYEMIQKRGGLKHKTTETFSTAELRKLLGVPAGTYPLFADFWKRCVAPAVAEVNALSDYAVMADRVRVGRQFTGVTIAWAKKDVDELKDAFAELQRPKVGRKARIAGTVERAEPAQLDLEEVKRRRQ